MNAFIRLSGGSQYRRISKAKARKLWGTGPTISLCPVKLRPGGPWQSDIRYFVEEQREREFDRLVNSFVWYNCQHNETGYYPAFYLVTQEVGK